MKLAKSYEPHEKELMPQNKDKNNPHKNEYLIYSRKSTDDAINQKNSISYQVVEALKYAKHERLPIAKVDIEGFCTEGIIRERHTAFKEDDNLNFSDDGYIKYRIQRPKFKRLVDALVKGEYKGVIFLCWDRASRNKSDNSVISKMINLGVDVLFVQATYEKTSSGGLHMNIDGVFSEHYSLVIREKVTNTRKKMRDEGICTYKAPIGYLNNGDPRHKPFDPDRSPLVKQLFEKYAEGNWTLADLARWANENGLITVPARRKRTEQEMLMDDEVTIDAVSRPMTFNHIHKILTNQFYIGKVLGNENQWVKSVSHAPLVDEDLFYRVQGLLRSKKVSVHYKTKPYFAYRGLVRCGECHRVYSPYMQKGIAYYGARCILGCKNKNRNINANFIEEKVGSKLFNLNFTKEELADIDRQTRGEVATLDDKRRGRLNVIDQEKRKLRDDLSYLRNNKLSLLKNQVYSHEEYLEQESDIASKLQKLRNEEEASDVSMQEVIRDVVLLSELLEDAYLYYSLANPTEKQQIITKVFSELTLFGKTLDYQCKNGFKVFEKKKNILCDPTENRTPISRMKT